MTELNKEVKLGSLHNQGIIMIGWQQTPPSA